MPPSIAINNIEIPSPADQLQARVIFTAIRQIDSDSFTDNAVELILKLSLHWQKVAHVLRLTVRIISFNGHCRNVSDSCTRELESSVGQLYTRIGEQCRTVVHENRRAVSDSCTRESESSVGQLYTRIGEQCRTVVHENRRAVSDSCTRESESNVGQLYTRIGEQCRTVVHENWRAVSDSCTPELESSVGQLYTRIGEQCRTVVHENRRAVSDSCTRELESSVEQLYTRIGEQCRTVVHENWRAVSDSCTRELESSVGQLYTRIGEQCRTCRGGRSSDPSSLGPPRTVGLIREYPRREKGRDGEGERESDGESVYQRPRHSYYQLVQAERQGWFDKTISILTQDKTDNALLTHPGRPPSPYLPLNASKKNFSIRW
ncbi:hypothetical protein J6590_035593 [Homalodisca vitripennis]|nr:hypothetical protein J6590_035593 [Homalodisca vitripennis]